MKRKSKAIGLIIAVSLVISTIPYLYLTSGGGLPVITTTSEILTHPPNNRTTNAEAHQVVWCPVTNATYMAGSGAEDDWFKWTEGNYPLNIGDIPGTDNWCSGGLVYNDYEEKMYTYGCAHDYWNDHITYLDPSDNSIGTLTEVTPTEITSIGAIYTPIENVSYYFGGQLVAEVQLDSIYKHVMGSNPTLLSTTLPANRSHMIGSCIYVPDLNIVVIAGGIQLDPHSNGGANTIFIFNCSDETIYTVSAVIPYNHNSPCHPTPGAGYPTSDMAGWYNTYDNLVYFAGGCNQYPSQYVYENSVWVYDPFSKAVENLQTTQSCVIAPCCSADLDDFGGSYNISSLRGNAFYVPLTTGDQRYIASVNQSDAFSIPQIEYIYQNMTLSDLTTYFNYEWNETIAINYPRYNQSTITDYTPIIGWYKVTTNGEWDGTGISNYNLTFADDSDFTVDVVTIRTDDYPSNIKEYGSLIWFQIPDSVDIGEGTRYMKVNGSGESDWWVFESSGDRPSIVHINSDTSSPVSITDQTPLFNWTFSQHSSTKYYDLQIANDSGFTDIYKQWNPLNDTTSPAAIYVGGNYIEFTVPEGQKLSVGNYFVRVRAWYLK